MYSGGWTIWFMSGSLAEAYSSSLSQIDSWFGPIDLRAAANKIENPCRLLTLSQSFWELEENEPSISSTWVFKMKGTYAFNRNIKHKSTCANMTNKPIHLNMSKFDSTKSLKSLNFPVGSYGRSWKWRPTEFIINKEENILTKHACQDEVPSPSQNLRVYLQPLQSPIEEAQR